MATENLPPASWKVEYLPGLSNDTYAGEAFKITTRDGTQYLFGSKPKAVYGGALTTVVFGNDPGEACHSSQGFRYSYCVDRAYRWNLDRVVNAHGNVIDYQWWVHRGNYTTDAGNGATITYDVSGTLGAIEYGANTVAGTGHTGRIQFDFTYRCS